MDCPPKWQESEPDTVEILTEVTACGCLLIIQPDYFLPNISQTHFAPFYVAQAVLHSVDLPMSLIGTILSLVFICLKKTNFLVRVFAYSTFPLTLLLMMLWLNNFAAFKPSQSLYGYCNSVLELYLPGLAVSLWIIGVLSFTISITLLQKLCSATCDCCLRQPQRNRLSPRVSVCLEVLFVMVAIMVPLLLFFFYCYYS